MTHLLEIVYEYQLLRSRRTGDTRPLDDAEEARLQGLDRLLKGDYAGGPSIRDRSRLVPPVPAELTIPGGFGAGEIHSLSGRGVAIVTNQAIPCGTRTILRIADPALGLEFVFPGTIVWGRGKVLGVAFDGEPSRTPFLDGGHASWRHAMRLGAIVEEPLVA